MFYCNDIGNKISTGVFPCTNLVTSTAIITATNAAIGFPVVAVLPLNVPAPIVPAITAAIRFNPIQSRRGSGSP